MISEISGNILSENKTLMESDSIILQNQLEEFAPINRAVSAAIERGCNSTKVTETACKAVGEVVVYIGKNIAGLSKKVPFLQQVLDPVLKTPQHIEQKYGIPSETSRDGIAGALFFIPLPKIKVFKALKVAIPTEIEAIKKTTLSFIKDDRGARGTLLNKVDKGVLENITIPLEKDNIKGKLTLLAQHNPGNSLSIWVDGLVILESNGARATYGTQTKTSGTTFLALQKIMELAKASKAKDIIIQSDIINNKLLAIAMKTKRLEYLGEKELFNPRIFRWIVNEKYPTFKLNIPINKVNTLNKMNSILKQLNSNKSDIFSLSKTVYLSRSFLKLQSSEELYFPNLEPSERLTVTEQSSLKPTELKKVNRVTSTVNNLQSDVSKQELGQQVKEPEPVIQNIYSSAVKVISEVKDLLPQGTEVNIQEPTKLKEMSVNVLHPVDDDMKAGFNLRPGKMKYSTISLAKDLTKIDPSKNPNAFTTSIGLNFNPCRIKKSTFSLTASNTNFSAGAIIKPRNLKNSQIQGFVPFGNYGSIGGTFKPSKPLQSTISAGVVVPIYGVPIKFGANMSLRKPLDTTLTASIPLGVVDVPILTLSIKKVSICGLKIFDKSKKKRKKAKRKAIEEQRLAMNAYLKAVKELELDQQKVLIILPHGFNLAKDQWMINDAVEYNEYHANITKDWKIAVSRGIFPGDCSSFVQMIQTKLEGKYFSEVASFSPLAHNSSPVMPHEFLNLPESFATLNTVATANLEQIKDVNEKLKEINLNFQETNKKFDESNKEIEKTNDKSKKTNESLEKIHEKFKESNENLKENKDGLVEAGVLKGRAVESYQVTLEALKSVKQDEVITVNRLDQKREDLAEITMELHAVLPNRVALANRITPEMRANLLADFDANF